jgi:hypothetical protein
MLEVLQTGDNAVKTVRIRPPPPATPAGAAAETPSAKRTARR